MDILFKEELETVYFKAPLLVLDNSINKVYELRNEVYDCRWNLMQYVAAYNVIIANLAHICYSLADKPFQQVVEYD